MPCSTWSHKNVEPSLISAATATWRAIFLLLEVDKYYELIKYEMNILDKKCKSNNATNIVHKILIHFLYSGAVF